MRDEKIGSPILSTYAAGGNTSRSGSGGRFFNGTIARPVIAILGAASVAAIVSVSFEGGAPIVTGEQSSAGEKPADGQLPSDLTELQPQTDNSIAANGVAEGHPAAAASQDLPFLSVLRPNAPEPVPRAAAVQRRPASRDPGFVPRPAAQPAETSRVPAAECTAGCVEDPAFNSGAALASVVAEPNGQARAEVVPASEELRAELVAPSDEVGLVSDGREALAADLESAGAPLADDGRSVLMEGQGSLLPAASASGGDQAQFDALPAVEEGVASSVAAGAREQPAEALETAAVDVVDRAPMEGVRQTTIPHHLARIDERYSPARAAEAPSQNGGPSEESALVTERTGAIDSAATVRVDVAGSSTAIVQEDELVAIKLGELVSLLEDRFDHPLYVWMKSSAAASKFVTAQTLEAAGIKTSYDPERKQIVISTSE